MAQNASDSQKVDYLWKKIVYGAAKTDISGNIDATNEPNPSPLQIRADKILQDSASIPGVIPGSNSSVVTVYPTTFPVECISTAAIPTPTLTWQTGRTFWVPPEFGSTYQIKVYIAPSGNAANVAGKGTQVFATGSGNNDLWVFDYQSGILNFNSNNTPYNTSNQPISFTGNSVYISGGVYAGAFGLPTTSNIGNVILGNITISNTTISTSITSANIYMSPSGNGVVQFGGNLAIGIPVGNSAQRPTTVALGYTRFNSETQSIELWTGNGWASPGTSTITSDVITPNGVGNTFTLSSSGTTTGVMVSINGTVQQPFTAYTVSGTSIIFTEVPLATDIVEVRHIVVGTATVSAEYLQLGTTKVLLDTANVNITGNLLPSANVTYDIGSPTLRWRTGYFSANTIDIGGGTIGLHTTLGFSFTTPGGTPQYMMPNGASTSNTFTSATTTIQGNLAVGGNIIVSGNLTVLGTTTTVNTEIINQSEVVTGNVTANYLIGSGQFITSLPGYAYSNVNLAAYLGGAVTIGGNLTVNGNLFVNGNLTTINANNLNIADSLIYLADNNPADILDIGFVSAFTSAIRYQHTGLVRDHTDGVWKLFANVVPEPTTTVDFTNASYSNLQIGNLTSIGGRFTRIVSIGTAAAATPVQSLEVSGPGTFPGATGSGADAALRIGSFAISSVVLDQGITTLTNDDMGWIQARNSTSYATPYSLGINFNGGNVILGNVINGYFIGNPLPSGNLSVRYGTVSTSTSTGALQVQGGVGITGNLNIGTGASASSTHKVLGNLVITGNILNGGAASSGNIGSSATPFNTVFATATTALYADLAENYVADFAYAPGTVVEFGGMYEVTQCNTDMSSAVAGVISEKPAYLMNSGQQGTHVVAVALQGRVKTQVIGPIRKGNMLVSAGNGLARAELRPETGTVIGKALEDFNGTQGTIEIVVGVR